MNLSVVLQKHTELTFTLAVGLDQYTSRNSVKQLLDELIPYLLSAQIRDILPVLTYDHIITIFEAHKL